MSGAKTLSIKRMETKIKTTKNLDLLEDENEEKDMRDVIG